MQNTELAVKLALLDALRLELTTIDTMFDYMDTLEFKGAVAYHVLNMIQP